MLRFCLGAYGRPNHAWMPSLGAGLIRLSQGAAAGRGSSRGGARRGAGVGRGGAQRDAGSGRGDLDREIERSFREQDRLQWRQSALLWDRELEQQRSCVHLMPRNPCE